MARKLHVSNLARPARLSQNQHSQNKTRLRPVEQMNQTQRISPVQMQSAFRGTAIGRGHGPWAAYDDRRATTFLHSWKVAVCRPANAPEPLRFRSPTLKLTLRKPKTFS